MPGKAGMLPSHNRRSVPVLMPLYSTATSMSGDYLFDNVAPGRYQLSFALINFASIRRDVAVGTTALRVDASMTLSLSAEVTVTGKRTLFLKMVKQTERARIQCAERLAFCRDIAINEIDCASAALP